MTERERQELAASLREEAIECLAYRFVCACGSERAVDAANRTQGAIKVIGLGWRWDFNGAICPDCCKKLGLTDANDEARV